ncbi:MAG TPA: type II secretion system F family protein [Acidimicrobiales bacterium]|nr:type II secretion system F family protein [Acidimicrobiales bacterium]
MATSFDYKVRDRSGNLIEGSLDGDNLGLVVTRLRSMGYLPVSVTPVSAGFRTEFVIPGVTDRIKGKDVAIFTRQFATMVDSGLSISRALSVLSAQIANKHFAKVIREVRDSVEAGRSLSEALSEHPKLFDELYVSMVRAGELGGSIDVVLKTVATQLEKQVALARKIRGAMAYPVVVVSVISLLFIAMMVLIVPVFKHLFQSLTAPLPVPTKIVIAISNTLASWHIGVVVAVLVLAVIGVRRWIATEEGREKWDGWKLRPPIFGPLAHKAALARFSFTLSSLISSGVPVLEALDIVGRATGNAVMAKATTEIKRAVREGRSFADPMRTNPVFPQLVVQMVEVGEQTGALDDMLGKAAAYYQGEVDQTVDNLSSILEPLLVVVMGGVVGTVIISLYLPMLTYIKYVH